jgi:release factor glutamine methyltransferase
MEARLLLAHVCGASVIDIVADRIAPGADALARFEAALARRIGHEPIAYIAGQREFWSLPFAVDKSVLIPRPESEVLIEEALRRFPEREAKLNVLDLGTGSGCLLLAFLSERPQARGLGIDVSADAVAIAECNAHRLGLSARARFLAGDWTEHTGTFDVVLANPPYIKTGDLPSLAPDVVAYEPRIALDGGPDGLNAYRAIAAILPGFLGASSCAFIELGQGQRDSVARIFAAAGLDIEGFVNDLSYIPRCLVAGSGAKAPHVKQKKDMEKETRSG